MSEINAGTRIAGRYKVIELIGSGGMANVYRALDLQEGREVAVKVLKSEYATDREFLRRFNSEAAAVLNLSHDNIVSSYDVGCWEDNHYIVLEYVAGRTLKELIRKEAPFENKRIISIGCQLCDALGHAHERNIIHRDVKPQNVMIGSMGRVKMADFGIARFTDASTVTYTGDNVLGSVHYVSPEQARGEKVDAKSDIYSLGIVLYEMATGRVPFDAENTVSVAIKHLQEEMVPPIKRNPAIGAALNGIIMKATAKDPDDRYNSMKELRRDLLRAVREPNEDFAGKTGNIKIQKEQKKPSDKQNQTSPFKRTLLLGLIVLIVVGLMTSFVMIGSALLNKNTRGEICYVPSLQGKSLSEAITSAESMGFVIKVRERVVSEQYAADTVIDQTPKAGNRGYEGDTIYVDVSSGPATLEAPKLTGLTLEEATSAAAEWGLVIGGVTFESDENSPPGTVFRQYPAEGALVYPGDAIQLYVNGSEEDISKVPEVTDLALEEAVQRLRKAGFASIFVRMADSAALPGRVVSQIPEKDALKSEDTVIELWISPKINQDYYADVAFNISVDQNDSTVMVLREADDVYYVLYEKVMQAGAQTVSLTVYGETEGPHQLIITVNGGEVRREQVTLSPYEG